MAGDIYVNLVDKYQSGLYRLSLQALETEAIDTFKEALKQFFTLDEAKLAIEIHFTPETISDLCTRTGKKEEEIYPFLKSMAEKACIQEVEVQGERTYQFFEWVTLMENFIRRTTKTDPFIEKMIRWWEDLKLQDSGFEIKPAPLRALPVEVEIEKTGNVLPYESITQVIKKQDYIAVAECYCRKPKRLIGEGTCNHPLEVCLVFGPMARYLVNYGYGKSLSNEEALFLLKSCEERGLIHMSDNIKDITWLCNCCGCCCISLSSHVKLGRTDTTSSDFIVSFDPEKCREAGICGTCIDRCQLKAITMRKPEDFPVIDYEKCIGCGSCNYKCPGDALPLRRRVPPLVPRESVSKLYEEITQNIMEQLSSSS
jgi:Na+-translocating ferredoxin:NAD+ oxidoreductase subunit B